VSRARLALAAVVLAALAGRASANDPSRPIKLEHARVGLQDDVYPGWVPVVVVLENDGPPLRARIEVSSRRGERRWFTAARTTTLPQRSKRRETLYITVGLEVDNVDIEIFDADRPGSPPLIRDERTGSRLNAIRGQRYYGNSEPRQANLVVVSPDIRDKLYRPWLSSSVQSTVLAPHVAHVEREDLPDRAIGWSSTDIVVLGGDLDTSQLSEPQRQALAQWVREGGRVLFIPSAKTGRSWFERDPIFRELLPSAKVRTVELHALKGLEGELGNGDRLPPLGDKPVPWIVIDGVPGAMSVLPELYPPSPDAPVDRSIGLFTRFPVGKGEVLVAAMDPDDPPLDTWRPTRRLAAYLLGEKIGVHNFLCEREHLEPLVRTPVTQGINASETPHQILVALIVALYIAVVGPINYALCRRWDHHVLIVATTPVIAIAATAVIFASGYIAKGVSTVVQRATFLEVQAGDELALERDYVAVRSASSSTYRVEFDKGLVPRQVFADDDAARAASQLFEQQDDGRFIFPSVPLNMWDHAFFEAHGRRPLGGKLAVGRSGSAWRVGNGTQLELGKGALLLPDHLLVRLPELPRGAAVEVEIPGSRTSKVKVTTISGGAHSTDEKSWDEVVTGRCDANGQAEALLGSLDDANAPYATRVLGRLMVERGDRRATYLALLPSTPSKVLVDGRDKVTRELHVVVAAEGGGQ
jgi:hypothetical protein